MDAQKAEDARAWVQDVELRKIAGEPVGDKEYADAHAAYTEAEIWRGEQEAQQRRDEMAAKGIVPGPTQGIVMGR